jgi:predicted ABC-type exoprotein transport system permease subunit
MTEPGHLKPRTVAIIFGVVVVAILALLIGVGAWPLAVGLLIAIILLPLFFLAVKVIGMIVSVIIYILIRLAIWPLPKKFRAYASTREQPAVVAVLIFAAMLGTLMLIFRSVIGVLAGLLIVGVLVGLPWLAEWSRERRLKKTTNKMSELTSGGRADASPVADP